MPVGKPSLPPAPQPTPGLHQYTRTWATSTWSSICHRSILVTCGSHGKEAADLSPVKGATMLACAPLPRVATAAEDITEEAISECLSLLPLNSRGSKSNLPWLQLGNVLIIIVLCMCGI
ncbi:hypothetical protein H5410_008810 [Solanum commersonii]|uniref:Uncharacterized protein n=1 Tax=Solanum commersonii TaxID=4109 RepID=A0A9J6AG89_SOLCO|nr:hypothetical protein H5410_008810 [Solanum commersonii]